MIFHAKAQRAQRREEKESRSGSVRPPMRRSTAWRRAVAPSIDKRAPAHTATLFLSGPLVSVRLAFFASWRATLRRQRIRTA